MINPTKWFNDNTDLWSNEGDHIEFYCPLDQVPSEVQQAAEAYRQNQINWYKKMEVINKLGLNGGEIVLNWTDEELKEAQNNK